MLFLLSQAGIIGMTSKSVQTLAIPSSFQFYTEYGIPSMAVCHGHDTAKACWLLIKEMLEDPTSHQQREEMEGSFRASCVEQALDRLSCQGDA